MDLGLAGRACLVTGASRGIGLATALRLVREGASVLLIARGEAALEEAAEACLRSAVDSGAGTDDRQPDQTSPQSDDPGARSEDPAADRIATLAIDVTADGAGERIVAACIERFGRIDALVNNAGAAAWRDLDDVPDADWRAQFELNVMAPLQAMRAAIPHMSERGWGRIVNVCSTAGKRPSALMADYSVAKAAELSLSKYFADRYAGDGVLINAVAPGPVRSEMWTAPGGLADQSQKLHGLDSAEEATDKAGAGRPIGRMAEVDEIADVIAFLCSERASYVAGSAWGVDGGTVPVII